MVFDYFLMKKVDVVIIEVGLGGLLDFINVVVLMLIGIIMIGFDYIEIFGEMIGEIVV